MRKITLMLFAVFALAISWQSSAQVQVGDGTNESQQAPFEPYYGYSYGQSIYLASEINASGDITGIQWYFSGTSTLSSSQDLTIYIGHTSKTEFSSTSDWEPVANLTQVYTGGITVAGTGWVTLTFDTPFSYNGTDNLIVAADENMSGYDSIGDDFHNTAVSAGRSICYYSDSTNPDPASPPAANSGIDAFVPNVIFEGIAQACPTPSGMTATNVTDTTADLTWTAGDTETSWNLEWSEGADFTPGTGAEDGFDSVSGTPTYIGNGLTPNTTYYIYYQADCGGVTSAWAGPFEFTTLCEAVTEFSENFDGVTTPDFPACWSKVGSSGSAYTQTTNPSSAPNTMYMYSSSTTNLAVVAMPIVSNLGDGTHRLRLDMRANFTVGGVVEFGYLTDPDDAASFVAITTVTAASTTYQQYIITPTAGTYSDYPAFRHTGSPSNSLMIDNVVWEPIPSCVEPSALDATIVSFTSADLSWTTGGGESAWNIEIVEAGTEPTGTPTASGVSNPYSATGLTAETNYEFYVQADCGGGDLSPWAGPFAFFTGYCVSEPTSIDGSGISNVQLVATDFAGSAVSYLNFTGSPVDIQQTVTENLQITFATGFTYDTNVWIDFNDDLVFEASEQVFDGVSASSNPTTLDASFLVPATAPLGNHRMRIGTADSGQATPDPCYNGTYGVTVDLDVNVTAAPACPDPSALTATNISSTGADLGWTEMGTATAWNVEIVDITGGGSVTGTATDTGVSNPFLVSGLTPNNDYEFYVQADCGSAWVGPFAFSTPCDTASIPFTEDFEGSLDFGCGSAVNEGSGNTWTVVNNPGYGFTTNALRYSYSFSSAANTWYFTQGINLTAGSSYTISYDYGSTGSYPENLQVAYGTDASSTAMTTQLADHPGIDQQGPINNEVDFTPTTTGVYYFGFQAYSTANQWLLMVDNISITEATLSVEESQFSNFQYYPNPVQNTLTLNAQNTIDNVTMYNMLGQEVLRATPNAVNSELDMSNLQDGTYFVKVNIANTTKTIRVIKQ